MWFGSHTFQISHIIGNLDKQTFCLFTMKFFLMYIIMSSLYRRPSRQHNAIITSVPPTV